MTATHRQPPLRHAAEAAARQDYLLRLKELEAMAPMLAQLDELVPALHEKGVDLRASSLKWSGLGGQIMVHQGPYPERSLHLHQALLELGFVEVERTPCGATACVTVRKGCIALRLPVAAS